MKRQERPAPGTISADDAGVAAAYDLVDSFVSGHLQPSDFERALPSIPSMPALLGEDLYLDLLSSNFEDSCEVEAIRSGLAKLLKRVRPLGSDHAPASEPSSETHQPERSEDEI